MCIHRGPFGPFRIRRPRGLGHFILRVIPDGIFFAHRRCLRRQALCAGLILLVTVYFGIGTSLVEVVQQFPAE